MAGKKPPKRFSYKTFEMIVENIKMSSRGRQLLFYFTARSNLYNQVVKSVDTICLHSGFGNKRTFYRALTEIESLGLICRKKRYSKVNGNKLATMYTLKVPIIKAEIGFPK